MIDSLLVSTSYPRDLADWRGLFIRHLVEALARRDDVALQLWAPPGEVPANVRHVATEGEHRWLADLMAAGGIAHLLRTDAIRAVTAPPRLLMMLRKVYRRSPQAALYHVNWLQNALVLPDNGRPLVAAVLGTDMQLLKLPLMRLLLRRACHNRRVAICPNAEWMVPALNDAFGEVAEIRVVPFGIDPGWFAVERTLTSVQKWLCVTRLTRGKLGRLFDWCRPHFADGQRELHLFGPMQEQVDVSDWIRYHGPATPAALRRDWFPQAHGLITLSQHAEGRPQVMLEAMAAGLPVIASRLPAHTELLIHQQTGWLCDDADDVGAALRALSRSDANLRMGAEARGCVACEIGTWDDCAERYVKLYRHLLGEKPE